MTAKRSDQTMKPETAAKKLAIHLAAAPEEFQNSPVTRSQLAELMAEPPEWLVELRKNGPHPRQEVARKLGVSNSGLTRGGATEPLTTAQISALLQAPPEWLVAERATHAGVQNENARVKAQRAEKARKRA
ncbi:MAG: DUF5997 family protein [Terrimesophilobacter sp.]